MLNVDLIILVAVTDFRRHGVSSQEGIHRGRDIFLYSDPIAVLDFHQHVKGRWGAAFQNGLLSAAPAGFVIRKGDGFDPTDQVG